MAPTILCCSKVADSLSYVPEDAEKESNGKHHPLRILSPEQAEARYGIPAESVRKLLLRRKLPPVRCGRKFGVTVKDIEKYIEDSRRRGLPKK